MPIVHKIAILAMKPMMRSITPSVITDPPRVVSYEWPIPSNVGVEAFRGRRLSTGGERLRADDDRGLHRLAVVRDPPSGATTEPRSAVWPRSSSIGLWPAASGRGPMRELAELSELSLARPAASTCEQTVIPPPYEGFVVAGVVQLPHIVGGFKQRDRFTTLARGPARLLPRERGFSRRRLRSERRG